MAQDITDIDTPAEFAEFLRILVDIMASEKVQVIVLPELLSQAADLIDGLDALLSSNK